MFAKAIEFDVKGKVVDCVTNNSVYSKGEAWTKSKYFGFISSPPGGENLLRKG